MTVSTSSLTSSIPRVPQILVPPGAVIAFNLASCPSSWTEFTEAQGRVILGVGMGTGLMDRTLLQSGGFEKHVLTPSEIPVHTVEVETWDNDNNTKYATESGNRKDLWRTKETRSRQAQQGHENMPPFVALRFCQKQ